MGQKCPFKESIAILYFAFTQIFSALNEKKIKSIKNPQQYPIKTDPLDFGFFSAPNKQTISSAFSFFNASVNERNDPMVSNNPFQNAKS